MLERASHPFVPYVAVAGKSLTVIAELSSASIQAGRWKDGAAVDVQAIGPNGEPLATAKGHIEAGSYSVAIPLTVGGVWPFRVTVALSAAGERPAEDWIKLEPPSGALVGEAVASRAASRIAPRPVAAFEFARNERLHVEWSVLAPLDRPDRGGGKPCRQAALSEDPRSARARCRCRASPPAITSSTARSGATVERLLAIRIKP